jgi:hypothetical protein
MHSYEDALPGDDEAPSRSGRDDGLALIPRSALYPTPGPPSWMRADLARLQAAFPAFSFSICRGWRGLMFEAWRDPAATGLYALITGDARELWRELEACQPGQETSAGVTPATEQRK